MPTLTLAVPQEMKREMDHCPEINWSEIAREAIRKRLAELALFKAIVGKSKLSEKEVEEFGIKLGRKINQSMHKRFKKLYPSAF